jgi:hypothetical protein
MLKRLLKALRIRRNLGDYKQDVLVKQGREQFKKLMERGTDLPVFLV